MFGTIADPMKYRVKNNAIFVAYVIVYNAVRCGVVCFERSSRFWLIERRANWYTFLGVDEYSAIF